AVEEKERLRAEREAAQETEQQELETLQGEAAHIGEEYAAVRAGLAGLEERDRAERSGLARTEQQFRETANRRNAIAAEADRLGEQRARLLASNVELSEKAALLAEEIVALEARVNQMASEEAERRETLRASEEELKGLRSSVQETQEKRSQTEIELVRKQAELKYLDE